MAFSASSSSSSTSSSPLSSPPMSPAPSVHYPLQNPRTQDVFTSIVKGRKSWKTLKGGEVVWPPDLEAALIEGLENYQPDDSRETRLLGRFPMRNKFISDWIFDSTGKRRTAKQVGSRLQQLRDTCGGKHMLSLLSPIRRPYRSTSLSPESHHRDSRLTYDVRPPRCESDSGSSDSSASTPATPIDTHATLQTLLYRGLESREEMPSNIVYIDLLRPGSSANDNDSTPSQLAEERSLMERGYTIVRANSHPRHLRDIDPTITLLAQSMTKARCYFTVYSDDRLIGSESTVLEPIEPRTSTVDGILYKTSLVPEFWDTISKSSDASQYSIIQRVVQDGSASSPPSTIFSAIYKFLYPTSTTPRVEDFDMAQMLTTTEPLFQTDDFSLESLLSMETDIYPDVMALTKTPDFFESLDFTISPDWSGPCSPNQSMFSSPDQYPQLMSNEDIHSLSPVSSFGIDIPNFL